MRFAFPFLLAGTALSLSPHFATGESTTAPVKTDAFGDPFPLGAVARIGTIKYLREFYNEEARLSPDGKSLAVPEPTGEIKIWELPGWKKCRVFRLAPTEKQNHVTATKLRFSPDGNTLACFDSSNRRIAFIDLESAKCKRVFDLPLKRRVSDLDIVIASDQQTFAASIDDGENTQCFVGDIEKDKIKLNFSVPGSATVAFSADCRWCAIKGEALELRDLRTGQTVWTMPNESRYCRLAFSPDNKFLVAVSRSSVRILDVATGKERLNQRRPSAWTVDVAFAPDGKSFYLGEARGQLGTEFAIWDAVNGK